MGIHQLQSSLISGTTAFAAAVAGKRVKVYAICLTGAGIIEESGGTDRTGILPTPCSIHAPQADFLLVSATGQGLTYTGAGTGFIVWAYETVPVVNQN